MMKISFKYRSSKVQKAVYIYDYGRFRVPIGRLEDCHLLVGIRRKKKAPGPIPGAQRRLLTKTHKRFCM